METIKLIKSKADSIKNEDIGFLGQLIIIILIFSCSFVLFCPFLKKDFNHVYFVVKPILHYILLATAVGTVFNSLKDNIIYMIISFRIMAVLLGPIAVGIIIEYC